MDREKKAAECKVDSIGSGRAIPIKQVSAPFPPRAGEKRRGGPGNAGGWLWKTGEASAPGPCQA